MFKFEIGQLVMTKAAVAQRVVEDGRANVYPKVYLIGGRITFEKKEGTVIRYELLGDNDRNAEEMELVSIENYNPNFTRDELLEFLKNN